MNKFLLSSIAILATVSACTQNEIDFSDNNFSTSNSLITRANLETSEEQDSIVPYVLPDSLQHINMMRYVFSSNLCLNINAVKDMPVIIEPREKFQSQNMLIETKGLNQKAQSVLGDCTNPTKNQKFYIQQIENRYSPIINIFDFDKKYMASAAFPKGHPNDYYMYFMNNDNNTTTSKKWTLYLSDNKGYLVIASPLVHGDPSFSDIYTDVCETNGKGDIKFSKYEKKENQDFTITVLDTFALKEINYIDDDSTTTITKKGYYEIVKSYTNTSYSILPYVMEFTSTVRENSSFSKNEGLNFRLSGLNQRFGRPTVIGGRISLIPSENDSQIASFVSSEIIQNPLRALKPLNIPARTKINVTYRFTAYDVKVRYLAKIDYTNPNDAQDYRSTTLTGIWQGLIHVDEGLDVIITEENLDTKQVKTYSSKI